MPTITIEGLPAASSLTNSDILHIRQSSVDKKITANQTAEFIMRNSDFADVIETRTADYDYPAVELEQDHKILVNCTAGDITLGLFNGSIRDGALIIIKAVGTGVNKVYVELISAGVSDYILAIEDTLLVMWDDTNSKWQIVDTNEIKKYNKNISSFTLLQNKKVYIEGLQIEAELPDDSVDIGDTIEIFANDQCKITQPDSESLITYLNKSFTTKGIDGYLQLNSKEMVKLIYKGTGGNIIEPGIKLSNPGTLPPNGSRGCCFSSDNTYLVVAHDTSPYITIYKRSGDTFTKLSDPATLPTNNAYAVCFSSNNTYLVVAHNTSPYITIYKRSGDTFTKLSDPATLPTGLGYAVCFSSDDDYLAVAHINSPHVTIYKRSGDTFTKLSDPAILPNGDGRGCCFSYNSNYLVVASLGTPYITIYKRNEDTFTKLSNPATLPLTTAYGVSFSYDDSFLFVSVQNTPSRIMIYKVDNTTNTFSILPYPSSVPSSGSCVFSSVAKNNKYAAFVTTDSPYIYIYKIKGDSFTKLSDPATLPTGIGRSCAFSLDGNYLAVAHDISPYITIYKNVESAAKTWEVVELNTLYPDNLDNQFK